jgi:hypothetical protein
MGSITSAGMEVWIIDEVEKSDMFLGSMSGVVAWDTL